MTAHRCPWPECSTPVPGNAVFCCDHHFRIAPAQARFLIRLRIDAARSQDASVREHLEEQISAYAASAVRAARKANPHTHTEQGGKSAA